MHRALIPLIATVGLVVLPDAAFGVVIERQGSTLVATGNTADEGFGVTVWNTDGGPMYAFIPNASELGPRDTVLEPGTGCTEPAAEVQAVICDMNGVTAITLDGGPGDDVLFTSGVTTPVTFTCGSGLDSVQAPASRPLTAKARRAPSHA